MGMVAPDWVHEAANVERWKDEDWGHWTRLKNGLHDLGLDTVSPADNGGSLRVGGREVIDLSETIHRHDDKPVLTAIERLGHKVTALLERHN